MSFQRKVERNQLKQQWKEHNKGVAKRYRASFSGFWDWFQRTKKKKQYIKPKRANWISFRRKRGKK